MGGFNNGGNAVSLQGYPIAVTGPTNNQVLTWNGSAWTPTTAAGGGVTSFNTRTGAVVPATGDYLAVPTGGLTGAVQATRYVGGTANGAPTSGTFAVGDFIVDATASIWICTTAGTPGTWSTSISNHMTLRSATATAKYNEITLFTGSTAGQTISAAASPLDSVTWTIINNISVTVTASFASNAMYPLGSASTVTSLSVPVNSAYSFVNYNGGNWYMVASNNLSNAVGTLGTANGGTGLTSLGTAGQVLTVNSGATALQYSTPASTTSVTMGGDVTGNSATSTVAKINGTTLGTLSGATSGQVLAWNGSAWAPATAGASLTYASSFITSNASITASTITNITSLSLAAGTWFVTFQGLFNGNANQYFSCWLGTTSASKTGLFTSAAYSAGSLQGFYLSGSGIVVLSSAGTVYFIGLGSQNTTVYQQSIDGNQITLQTGINAIKIG
jgi:hypothetical protein